MRCTKWVAGVAWICVSAATPTMMGEVVSVDLELTPPDPMNVLEITLTADVSGLERADSDVTTATGNLLAELAVEFDPLTHQATSVDSIEFAGGALSLSDMSFKLDLGFLLGVIDASGSGIGGTVATPDPPGAVIAGDFSTLDHLVILDQGIFEATATGMIGVMLPENPYIIDLSAEPIPATTDAIGQIAVAPPVIHGDEATYDVTLTLPVDFSEVIFELTDPLAATLNVRGIGTLEATGAFARTLPGPKTLTWDGLGDGDWDSPTQWIGGDAGDFPNAAVGVSVLDDMVTVASHADALSLTIADRGAVRVGRGNTLTVVEDVDVRDGLLVTAAAGTLNVGRNLIMRQDSQYVCELDGPANGLVSSLGDVQLGGMLTVLALGNLTDLSMREWGDVTRRIITAGGDVNGALIGEPTGGHLGYGVFYRDVIYPAHAVDLNLLQAAPGDTDGDGRINNTDLQLILAANSFNNGTGFDWIKGDFDGDTDVDNSDLQLVLATGLFNSGTYATVALVPEPGTLALLAGGIVGLLLWRRRRRD